MFLLQEIINGAQKWLFQIGRLLTCRDEAFKSLYKSMGNPGRYKGFDSGFDTNEKMNGGDFVEWAWTSFSTPPNQTPANVAELEKGLTLLANNLKEKAVGGDNNKKFTYGAKPYGPGPGPGAGNAWPLYGYMQCTPSISKDKCMKCLNDVNNFIHNCCGKGRKLCAIALSTNCYFWYAHMDFSPKKL
ncbi:hypothetical protein L1987_56598 [Smallanthus sonchifolius]|uniref:Uncharacterized protein n=1 Tax=Smallanthus sonchifolius TaxID=185202 RepID=A0ACB9EDL0_9ASTR|nr:hypothetical protein L1987_56598 [Smallanthus sonchifolius]